MAANPERQAAEAALENLGQPGLRDLVQQAAAGDRALAALPRPLQRDAVAVMRAIAGGADAYSEVGVDPAVRHTIDRLVRWGMVELTVQRPWTAVALTARGRHFLAGMWAPPPKKKE